MGIIAVHIRPGARIDQQVVARPALGVKAAVDLIGAPPQGVIARSAIKAIGLTKGGQNIIPVFTIKRAKLRV